PELSPGATVVPAGGIAAAAVPAVGATYLESPEDVGATAPPPVAPTPPKGARAGAAVAGAAGEEPNIDALMDELDRISGEILKKDKVPKGAAPTGESLEGPSGEGP
ncbi:MAG: hypothetical protein ACREC5_06385, partial [Thermoplasmata archaeon]